MMLSSNHLGGKGKSQVLTITSSTVWTPPVGVMQVEVLLVGGGGGGGPAEVGETIEGEPYYTKTSAGGGGGGGQVIYANVVVSHSNPVTITIGAGGIGGWSGTDIDINPRAGSSTSFVGLLETLIAVGGGADNGDTTTRYANGAGKSGSNYISGGGGGGAGGSPANCSIKEMIEGRSITHYGYQGWHGYNGGPIVYNSIVSMTNGGMGIDGYGGGGGGGVRYSDDFYIYGVGKSGGGDGGVITGHDESANGSSASSNSGSGGGGGVRYGDDFVDNHGGSGGSGICTLFWIE